MGTPAGIDALGNAACHLTFLSVVNRLGDVDAAAYSLQEVLGLDRHHPEALALLAQRLPGLRYAAEPEWLPDSGNTGPVRQVITWDREAAR